MAVESVGDILRSERLRQGLRLREIAASTKIRPEILEAIEAGHLGQIPSGAYRRSFLRQYAHALGVDEDAMMASFHEQYQDPPVDLPAPVPDPPSQALRRMGILVALVLSVLAYRYAISRLPVSVADTVATAHQQPATASAALTPAPAPPPAPRPAAEPENAPVRSVRVEFSASEPVWVSVKCDGTETFTGTLQGPQVKTFAASSLVTVLVGNAGGLAILLNGRPVAPLGARGEIQLVEFTPSGFRKVPRRLVPSPAGVTVPQA
jgi:cytoskeletal protein RodZ